jgi:hypothetical protein
MSFLLLVVTPFLEIKFTQLLQVPLPKSLGKSLYKGGRARERYF